MDFNILINLILIIKNHELNHEFLLFLVYWIPSNFSKLFINAILMGDNKFFDILDGLFCRILINRHKRKSFLFSFEINSIGISTNKITSSVLNISWPFKSKFFFFGEIGIHALWLKK